MAVPDVADFRRELLGRLGEGTRRSWQRQENGIRAHLEFGTQKDLFQFLQRLPSSRLVEKIEPESLVLELEVAAMPVVWPDFKGAFLGLFSFTLRVTYVLILFLPLWLAMALVFAIWRREKAKDKVAAFFASLRKGRALEETGKVSS